MAKARMPETRAEMPLAGLLLAAGGARRLRQPKQLVRVDGLPLVRRQAELLAGLVEPLIVVTGAYREEVRGALAGTTCQFAHNPRWREGLGASLARGAARVDAQADGVLVVLCDQYRLDRATLTRLIAAWREAPSVPAACRWRGASGPPAVFPAAMLPALRSLGGDAGARGLLARHPQTRYVEAPLAGPDLDTPADLERLLQSPSR